MDDVTIHLPSGEKAYQVKQHIKRNIPYLYTGCGGLQSAEQDDAFQCLSLVLSHHHTMWQEDCYHD